MGHSSHFVQHLIDAMWSNVAVLDADGQISFVNHAWRTFGTTNNLATTDYGLGLNYLQVWKATIPHDDESANRHIADLKRVIRGDLPLLEFQYPCHSSFRRRWFNAQFTPIVDIPQCAALVVH